MGRGQLPAWPEEQLHLSAVQESHFESSDFVHYLKWTGHRITSRCCRPRGIGISLCSAVPRRVGNRNRDTRTGGGWQFPAQAAAMPRQLRLGAGGRSGNATRPAEKQGRVPCDGIEKPAGHRGRGPRARLPRLHELPGNPQQPGEKRVAQTEPIPQVTDGRRPRARRVWDFEGSQREPAGTPVQPIPDLRSGSNQQITKIFFCRLSHWFTSHRSRRTPPRTCLSVGPSPAFARGWF